MMFPRTRAFGLYHQGWKSVKKTHSVDAISGGFFFARRNVFDKVGLLDEGFFMYGEDLDLCMRIAENDMKIAFYPRSEAIHLKGYSGIKNNKSNKIKKTTNKYFWETMKLFYQKHYANQYPKIVMWIIFKVIDWKSK